MIIKRICDNCGKETGGGKSLVVPQYTGIYSGASIVKGMVYFTEMDLCEHCIEAMADMLWSRSKISENYKNKNHSSI